MSNTQLLKLYKYIIGCEQRDGPPRSSAHHVTGRLKLRLLNVNSVCQKWGGEICTVLSDIHYFTGCDTTSVFVSQKGRSFQTYREPLPLGHPNSKQGRKREKLLLSLT